MNVLKIPVDKDALYQIISFNANDGDVTIPLRVELRHLTYVDKWYLSVFNAQTGEPYCLYVPVVTSQDEMNNLVSVYDYKRFGWFCCVAIEEKASTEDPQADNIEEFELYWGDSLGQ